MLRFLTLSVVLPLVLGCASEARAHVKDDKDPHRPACTDARCKKIKNFLQQHYCGEPVGNGPDESCDLREQKPPVPSTKVIANFECKWNQADGTSKCEQTRQPSEEVRSTLLREMRLIGLPAQAESEVHYSVMESTSGWWLMMGSYEHVTGENVVICEIIVARKDQQDHILRTVPLRTTDADVPEVTRWLPLDIADVDGDGHMKAVLEGDEYENHWLEVISLDDPFKTIFSGLGYYL